VGGRQRGPKRERRVRALCGSAASAGRVAHGAIEEGALHCFELGQEGGNFSKEGVRQDGSHLLIAAAARVPHQLAHVDFKSGGEPFKGAEGGDGLAVFDFGDVGAGNLHAAG